MKYKTKNVEVDAIRVMDVLRPTDGDMETVFKDTEAISNLLRPCSLGHAFLQNDADNYVLQVTTVFGKLKLRIGDWIINHCGIAICMNDTEFNSYYKKS